MPKLNRLLSRGFGDERGVIAQFLILLLLGVGLVVGVYLIQNRTTLFSRAAASRPIGPETSLSLVGPSSCTAGLLCVLYVQQPQEEFAVNLYARSDLETANLFKAKMTFPKDLVEVKEIRTGVSFVKNWVENFYDNNTGEISLVGGVPSPGYQTQVGGESALMATIVFRDKALGKGTVAFADNSAIYSNLNNINILTTKRPYDISVEVKPSPTPESSCIPRPACLDAQPPCTVAVPLNGNWCPTQICEHPVPPVGCQYAVWEDVFPACAAKLVCPPSPVPSASPVAVPGSGDANKDGKVDLIDLSILLSDYNKNGGFRTEIDLNGDGAVNAFDFALMRNILIQKGVVKS